MTLWKCWADGRASSPFTWERYIQKVWGEGLRSQKWSKWCAMCTSGGITHCSGPLELEAASTIQLAYSEFTHTNTVHCDTLEIRSLFGLVHFCKHYRLWSEAIHSRLVTHKIRGLYSELFNFAKVMKSYEGLGTMQHGKQLIINAPSFAWFCLKQF